VASARFPGALRRTIRDVVRREDGAVSTMLTLALVPICGAIALAGEVGYWSTTHRNLQHAADTAALAAAANADATLDSGVERYKREASAVAANYNLGAGATVTTVKVDCPGSAAGANDCYRVTIDRQVPFVFARVAGFTGVAYSGGGRAAQVTAVSYAKERVTSQYYCAIALGTGGITLEGQSSGWNKCNARSNGQVKCTSNDFKMIWGPSQKTCSSFTQDSTTYTDPYTGVGAKIPDTTQVPCSANLSATPTVVSGTSFIRVCTAAAAKLSGNLTLSTSNTAVIFDNVSLNTNGSTLTVSNGSLVYTNSSGTLPGWFTADGGSVKVTAPTSGTFANFSMVDNPLRTTTADYDTKKGPDLYLAGVLYAPNRNVVFSGPVYSALGSYTCLAFITKSLDSNGGKLPNTGVTDDCDGQGYVLPGTPAVRQALVQ
jgi:Flp pilus assembly protein TadG